MRERGASGLLGLAPECFRCRIGDVVLSKSLLLRGFLLVCILVVATVLLRPSWLKVFQPAENPGPIFGTAASWQSQLSAAYDLARKEMSDPTLVAAHSVPSGGHPDHLVSAQSFQMEFLFANGSPQHSWLYIVLNDSQPAQTIHKNGQPGFSPQTDVKSNLEAYSISLKGITVSARDAYTLTMRDASSALGTSTSGYLVDAYLHIVPDGLAVPAGPPLWAIYYSRTSGSGTSPDLGARVDYLVDARTGAIRRRQVQPYGSQLIPRSVAP